MAEDKLRDGIEREREAVQAYADELEGGYHDGALAQYNHARTTTDKAVEAVERAVTRLSAYAGHLYDCATHGDEDEPCTCGYDDAWNGVFSRSAGVGLTHREREP